MTGVQTCALPILTCANPCRFWVYFSGIKELCRTSYFGIVPENGGSDKFRWESGFYRGRKPGLEARSFMIEKRWTGRGNDTALEDNLKIVYWVCHDPGNMEDMRYRGAKRWKHQMSETAASGDTLEEFLGNDEFLKDFSKKARVFTWCPMCLI